MNWLLWFWFIRPFTLGFFGIGMGTSPQEKSEFGAIANVGNFGTSAGEGDISAANNFWKSILSGDPSKISQVLGPEISGINKRGQQEKKTMSEFGTRSGGTAATAATIDDKTRSSVDELISRLTGTAAGELGALGTNLFSTGLGAHEAGFSAAKTMHDEHAAKMNDIFKSIAETAGAVFGGFGGGGGAGAAGISSAGDVNAVLSDSGIPTGAP